MDTEELRLRSLYLFLSCSQAIEQFTDRLVGVVPSPSPSGKRVLEQAVRRELAMLFRYWMTRQIWEQFEANEGDAKHLNLALLRLFTNAFKLPRDGSGLRYASLSTLAEELQELRHRITNSLGMEHHALLAELQGGIVPWREAVVKYTTEGLELPLAPLSSKVKMLAEQVPRVSAP